MKSHSDNKLYKQLIFNHASKENKIDKKAKTEVSNKRSYKRILSVHVFVYIAYVFSIARRPQISR